MTCLHAAGTLTPFRARRACLNPAARCLDKLGVCQRRQRPHGPVGSSPGIPGPKDQRLFLVMLQQTRSVESVILRTIRHRTTHGRARKGSIVQALPSHGQGRQVPIVPAGNSGTVGIGVLMTTRTIESRHTFAFWTPNDVCEVTVAIISLLRIGGGGVTIDAARMSQHRINLLPCGQPVAAFGSMG